MKCLNCLNFVTAHPFLGHNQLIVWFASAARPNLELENPNFVGTKMKFQQLLTCGYKGG